VSLTRWERASLAGIGTLFVAIRLPLYSYPGLILGWNSDAALFGMMARAMREGWDFPVYFWGQFYLGTLTSMLSAIAGLIIGEVGPLALRIAAALEVATAAVFFWLALRRELGRVAMVALLWLAAGPAFLFHFTVAPIGAEELLLAASLLFWYATRARFDFAREWLVLGAFAGLGTWLHQGVVFLCAGIAIALLVERKVRVRFVGAFAIGFAAGYVPALLSLLRNDPLLYKRTYLPWSVVEVVATIAETVRSDLWLLLADASAVGIAAAAGVLVLAVLGLRGRPWTRGQIVIVATIAASGTFWIFTTYGYPGAVRYLVPVVPLLYGAAAAGLARCPRAVAGVAVMAIALALFVPRIREANDVAAGRAERYVDWPAWFDPRPTLATLRAGGYRVCYGEVWVAHKLEWISSPTVRFVPVRSVHRTLKQSLVLIREPGPKCFVDNFGKVKALTPEEEAMWAASVVERGRKAGLVLR
jgi:hypothetical protein